MSTIVGSYTVPVAPVASWTAGPVFRKGETVRVRASGAVAWRAVDGAGPTYPAQTANPSSGWLVSPTGNGSDEVSVSTQAGQYGFSSAVGSKGGGYARSPYGGDASTLLIVNCASIGPGPPLYGDERAQLALRCTTACNVVVTVDAGGLSNSSSLAVGMDYGAFSVPIAQGLQGQSPGLTRIRIGPPDGPGALFLDFARIAGGAPETIFYGLPEGAYPTSFPIDHAYDPPGVLAAADWTGSTLVATGRPPLSLAMLVLPDGQAPAFAATSGCLSPGRETAYDAETGLGASDPDLYYRLWFVVNDGLGDFTDDSGGYTVLVDRIRTSTMALPLESLISPRFGLQPAIGTRIDATRMLGCIADKGFKPKPDQQWEESGTAGFGYQTDSTLVYDVSSGDATLNLDTLDTGYVLYSVFGGETVTTLATGVYKHDFEFGPFTQAVPPAYSVQTPTEAGEIAQATMDLVFNGLKIGTDPGKLPTASSSFLAGKLSLTGDTDMPTLSVGVNCVQLVSVNGAPTSGTFVLLDHTRPSGAINTTDTASVVQTAVRLLGGDYAAATVAGSAGAWTITSPTGKRLAPLVPDYTNAANQSTLVGGTAPTITVAVTNPGGFKINPVARCSPQSWCLKVAASWAAMENAPISMTANWSSSVTIGERYVRKWIQSCSPGVFTYNQKDGKDVVDTLELEMALVDPVRTFVNASRSGQRLCARLQSTGAQIGATGFYRSFTVDMDGQAKWPDNTDSDNVRSVKIDFRALYNMASGQMLRVSIVNEIPSYSTN